MNKGLILMGIIALIIVIYSYGVNAGQTPHLV